VSFSSKAATAMVAAFCLKEKELQSDLYFFQLILQN